MLKYLLTTVIFFAFLFNLYLLVLIRVTYPASGIICINDLLSIGLLWTIKGIWITLQNFSLMKMHYKSCSSSNMWSLWGLVIVKSCVIVHLGCHWLLLSPIARFMGPTWGPSGADRTQVGPMLAHELCYLGCLVKLFPVQHQVTTCTRDDMLSIRHTGTRFNWITFKFILSFKLINFQKWCLQNGSHFVYASFLPLWYRDKNIRAN